MSQMTLDKFNQLNTQARAALLHDCCHCQSWANTLAEAAPFSSVSELTQQATQLFAKASEAEILEAFQGHAKIGDIELLKSKYAGKAQNEQGQVLQANEQTNYGNSIKTTNRTTALFLLSVPLANRLNKCCLF